MLKQGAEIIYTYQNERMKKSLVKLVGEEAFTVECDVSSDESIEKAMNAIGEYAGRSTALSMQLLTPTKKNCPEMCLIFPETAIN